MSGPGRVGSDAPASHGVFEDRGHEVDRLPDTRRAEPVTDEVSDPACQPFEGDAVYLDRSPGRHDMAVQECRLYLVCFRLDAGAGFEPSGSVLTEGDASVGWVDPVALRDLGTLLGNPAFGVGLAFEALAPLTPVWPVVPGAPESRAC